ncbi:uncharacterized protein METZ01_LOCUS321541, partial [marine metagenome]
MARITIRHHGLQCSENTLDSSRPHRSVPWLLWV